MIVMCHKAAQINNTCSPSADTIYIKTYKSAAFSDNFKTTFKSKHKINDVFEKVLSADTQEISSKKFKKDELVARHGTLSNLDLQYGIIKYKPNNDSFKINIKFSI